MTSRGLSHAYSAYSAYPLKNLTATAELGMSSPIPRSYLQIMQLSYTDSFENVFNLLESIIKHPERLQGFWSWSGLDFEE